MEKTIFEQMGGTYEQQGDYLIPCLTLPSEGENQLILTNRQKICFFGW